MSTTTRAATLAAIEDTRTRSLLALLLWTPEELEAERRARETAPAPQTPGSRKGAKDAPRRTQAGRAGLTTLAPVHFPPIKREPRARAYHSENPCAYISQNPRARVDSENSRHL